MVDTSLPPAADLIFIMPRAVAAPPSRRLQLELQPGYDGRPALYFPFRSTSDVHFGARQSRAKRFCQMREHTVCDYEVAAGDIIDGQAMMKKEHYNLGPYHRQGIAHYLRAADTRTQTIYLLGNHEYGLESSDGTVRYVDGQETYEPRRAGTSHRNLIGKTLFRDAARAISGIRVEEKVTFVDPAGDLVEAEHGHKHDAHLFKTVAQREKAYSIGNIFLDIAYDADEFFAKRLKNEDFSIAGWVKREFKNTINGHLGIRDAMSADLDRQQDVRRRLYGHSHAKGFQVTPSGKVLMNDGSSTDHVESLVCDRHGTWAITTWHKDRMDVLLESGEDYAEYFGDIGRCLGVDLSHFSEPPKLLEDPYTVRADRLLRLIYRQWPSKDRQQTRDTMDQKLTYLSNIDAALSRGESVAYPFMRHYFKVASQIEAYTATPVSGARRAAVPDILSDQAASDRRETDDQNPEQTWSKDRIYELAMS